jgi:nicotinate-nucleotide adenylyltransferase
MQLLAPLGIFGGTFDPIHNGHIYPVIEAAKKAKITKVALMPCYIPSHKNAARVSSSHRLKMLELVCDQSPLFYPDPRDIERGKATFSIDSLQELRTALPNTPLCFFIGTDSLQNLCSWYKWQDLFSLCHFVVCEREGASVQNLKSYSERGIQLNALLKSTQTLNPQDLHTSLCGRIYIANTQTLTLSSSDVRQQLSKGELAKDFLPSEVLTYIQQHKLYQTGADF